MMVGFTGKNGAGKTTACEYLRKKGFFVHSLSDEIREEARKRKMPETRENLISLGNELREKYGAGVLAQRTLKKMEGDKNYAIDSIRNPEEVTVLRERKEFHLVEITASQETRFRRLSARGREGEPKTLAEFRKIDSRESKGGKNAQQLEKLAKMAEHKIQNNGELEGLREKIDALLAKLPQHFERPSWDQYFIDVAKVVSARSNCVKRKVAAILVKDKRIISTGYNGTPRGTKNCNEGGCPRCNGFSDSGKNLEECLCSHGEENAIVQASYHGIAVKGSTLYSTYAPCLTCAKLIINAGIERVVYNQEYPLNETAQKILKEAGIALARHQV